MRPSVVMRLIGLLRGVRQATKAKNAAPEPPKEDAERLLARLHRQYSLVLQSIGEGVYCIDMQGNATIVNPAGAEILGYAPEELLGRNMHDVLHHSHEDGTPYPVVECPIYAVLHGGGTCRVDTEVFWRRDGTSFPVEYLSTPLIEDGKVIGMVVSFRDVTERRQHLREIKAANALLEEQAAELEHQQVELTEVNSRLEALATTDGLTGLKNHRAFQERLNDEVERSHRYKTPISIVLIDVDKFKAYNDKFGHPEGDRVLKTVGAVMQATARQADCVCRYGGEEFAIILPNIGKLGAQEAAERIRAAIEAHSWEHRPVTASLGVATFEENFQTPQSLVESADRALYVSKAAGRNRVTHVADLPERSEEEEPLADVSLPFSDLIQELLQYQSDTMSSASEQVRESLFHAYEATIKSWSHLLDMREKEMEGHGARVTEMTVRLVDYIGLDSEDIMYARWGAMLHDIGKLGIPDRILHKPGPLIEEEWAVMRQHPTIAYEMLQPITFLLPALDIPYCHHEKWDGTGYPRGLKGDEIPLIARIFAVIDVYDALTNARPYSKAWSKRKAVAHLRSLAGTHFDPRAVKVFLTMLNRKPSTNQTDQLAA